MEKVHRPRLNQRLCRWPRGKRIVVLNISDLLRCMDPTLIRLLKERCAPYLP